MGEPIAGAHHPFERDDARQEPLGEPVQGRARDPGEEKRLRGACGGARSQQHDPGRERGQVQQ